MTGLGTTGASRGGRVAATAEGDFGVNKGKAGALDGDGDSKGKSRRGSLSPAERGRMAEKYLPRAKKLYSQAYRRALAEWPERAGRRVDRRWLADELYSAALDGLAKAVEYFDPAVNANPATLVSIAVRQALVKAVRREMRRWTKSVQEWGIKDTDALTSPRGLCWSVADPRRPKRPTFEDRDAVCGPNDGHELTRLWALVGERLSRQARNVLAGIQLGLRGEELLAAAGVKKDARDKCKREIAEALRGVVRESETWAALVEETVGADDLPLGYWD